MNSLKVTLIKINELVNEMDGVMKKRSIQKLLHEVGRHKWKQLSRPKLPGIHAIKRLQWAREYENYTPEDWARVQWSDECTVERCAGVRPIWIFRRPSDQLHEKDVCTRRIGKGVKQMFWAAFGDRIRTGLIPLDGDPDSK